MADVNTNNINAVKTLKDQGKIKYVLGFNKPNRADQSKPEQLDYVKRYSWFSGDPKSAQMWSSALIDVNGNLTELGKWYASYQPNTAIAK